MPDKQNNKEIGKNYQQKAKQKTNTYQQEEAEELTKTQQRPNQYQQEVAQDFLNTKQTGKNRSGYIVPDMNEEAGMEHNTDKIVRTGKKDLKKQG